MPALFQEPTFVSDAGAALISELIAGEQFDMPFTVKEGGVPLNILDWSIAAKAKFFMGEVIGTGSTGSTIFSPDLKVVEDTVTIPTPAVPDVDLTVESITEALQGKFTVAIPRTLWAAPINPASTVFPIAAVVITMADAFTIDEFTRIRKLRWTIVIRHGGLTVA